MSASDGLLPELNGEVEDRLRRIIVDIGHGRTRTLYDLILGWAAHVRKLRSELATNVATNPTAWNEHDFVGALFIRDFVEGGLLLLEDNALPSVQKLVAQVDKEFLSFTQDGYRSLLASVAGIEASGRNWWWDRAPVAGPVLDQLNKLEK